MALCSRVHALPSLPWKQAQERPQGQPAWTQATAPPMSVPGRPPSASFPRILRDNLTFQRVKAE